jgi:hypothetical protein
MNLLGECREMAGVRSHMRGIGCIDNLCGKHWMLRNGVVDT